MTRWTVVCPDGHVRHPVLGFDSRQAAVEFAEHGHACMAADQHAIESVEVDATPELVS